MLHSQPDHTQDTSKRIRRPYKRVISFVGVCLIAAYGFGVLNLNRQVEEVKQDRDPDPTMTHGVVVKEESDPEPAEESDPEPAMTHGKQGGTAPNQMSSMTLTNNEQP